MEYGINNWNVIFATDEGIDTLPARVRSTDASLRGENFNFQIISVGQEEVCLIYNENFGTIDVSHEYGDSKLKEA